MESAKKAEETSDITEIYGAGIANVLDKFKPFIAPGEIITGFNFGDINLVQDGTKCDIALTYGDCYIANDTLGDRALMRENGIREEDVDKYFEIDPFYRNEWFLYGGSVFSENSVKLSKEENEAVKDMSAIGRCICHNHSVIGYEKVLRLRFEGLLKEIEAYENKNRQC